MINLSKIKAHTPNLRVVSLYGITFVDDSHVELLSNNCIHLECVALNFCLKVTGSSLKPLLARCKKIRTLLMQHCGERSPPFPSTPALLIAVTSFCPQACWTNT